MKSLLGHLRAIGWLIVAFVLVVPLSVSVITAVLAPRIVTPNYQSTSQVPLALFSGSHASYEASTYAADFDTAISTEAARQAAADASGESSKAVATYLTTTHYGDTTYATAVFTATTEQAAAAGLRAGIDAALAELTIRQRQRAEMEVTGADAARLQTLREQAATTAPPTDVSLESWRVARDEDVARASDRLAAANSVRAVAQVAERSANDMAAQLPVSVNALSTTSDQIRMVGAAGLSALFLTVALAVLVKWVSLRKSGRRTPPAPDARDAPQAPNVRDEPDAPDARNAPHARTEGRAFLDPR